MTLTVTAVPAFRDNYIWLLQRDSAGPVYVVDPGDAAPVVQWLEQHEVTMGGILLTHHHPDHTGGVDELLDRQSVPVYGPRSARIPQVSHILEDDASVELLGETFHVIAVPGHTLDHIAFHVVPNDTAPLLFCGDTLFAAGCGRLFEGTPEMMFESLGKLAQLAQDTRVYCAHEYTLANLAFASAVEPDNQAIQQRVSQDREKLAREGRTLPSTLSLELRTNPFLRCHIDSVRRQSEKRSGQALNETSSVFATLRQWKDTF